MRAIAGTLGGIGSRVYGHASTCMYAPVCVATWNEPANGDCVEYSRGLLTVSSGSDHPAAIDHQHE